MSIFNKNYEEKAVECKNFTAFCIFSLLTEEKSLKIENLVENFNKIKSEEKTDNNNSELLFNISEFTDFMNLNPTGNYIIETIDINTRLKLRRAAKRTSRMRARKRKIKEKLRKNKTQLAKRAYNQIKTEMRNKLTGGKPWSSLPLSTRQRIDTMISRRKPMFTRLVKQRTQKMPAQESKRLRKLAMRENVDYSYKYLIEKALTGAERKQKHDQLNKQDPNRFLAKSLVVINPEGETEIIEKESFNSNYHTDERQLKSAGEAQKLCKDASIGRIKFHKTDTSDAFCGEFEVKSKKSKSPRLKRKNKSMNGTNTTQIPGLNKVPPPPAEGLQAPAVTTEVLNVTAANMLNIENPEFIKEFQRRLLEAQQAYRSKKVGAEVTLEQEKSQTFITDILTKYGLDNKQINTALEADAAFPIAFEAADRMNQTRSGVGDRTLGSFYPVSVGTVNYKTTAPGVNGTGKPDILFVPMEAINPNGNMDSNQIIEALQKWKKEYTDLVRSKKELTPEQIKRLAQMQSGIIKVSQKTGQAQSMSGAVSESGDATVLMQKLLEFGNISEIMKGKITEFLKQTKELNRITTRGTLDQITEIGGDIISKRFKDHVAKLEELFQEIVNDPEVKKTLIRFSYTGEHKFDPNDPESAGGIATHILTISDDGKEVKFTEINDAFIEKVAEETKIYLRMKSSSVNTALEAQNKELYLQTEELAVSDALTQALQKDPNLSLKKQTELKAKTQTELYKRVYDLFKKVEAVEGISLDDTDKTELKKRIKKEGIKLNQVDEYKQDMLHRKKIQAYIEQNPTLSEEDKKLMQVRPILRSSWIAVAAEVNENLVVRFSHNSLLRMLLEFNADNPDKANIELENHIKTMMQYQEQIDKIQFEYAGTDINKIMQILDVSIDTIRMDPVDIAKYIPDQGDGRFNSIYINGKYHQVPLVVSEMYSVLAKSFLEENKKRNYRGEYDNYHSKPDQRKNRSKRNMARRWAERKGLVRKGDGKDVDHKNGDPRDNSPRNLRVRSRSTNRADND